MPTEPNERRAAVDDDAWLQGLAGTAPASAADDPALREGRAMREALLRWQPQVDPVAADDAQRMTRLLARARTEGVLPPARPAVTSGSWIDGVRAWWAAGSTGHRRAFAAAFAVVLVVGLVFIDRAAIGPAVDDTVRSAPDSITLLRVPDPVAARRALVASLASAGVAAVTYERLGRLGVDADLPADPPPALVAALKSYRIPLPTDRVLKVEFETADR